DDDEESVFPNIYVVPDLPPKLQQIIQKGELNEFRSHTNVRRLLLDTIFNHVTNEYSLLYPNKDQYKSMGKAILKTLNIPKDKEILNEWIESLKNKFKRERRPLQQTSAEVQQMKVKYGNSIGRPIKRTNNLIAPRRVSSVEFWNKIDLHDDPEDLHKNVQFMKNELVDQNFDWDQVKNPWKKTLVQRRTFIRDHTTKEVPQEYPGYRYALLIFDEVRYVCNVDIELNLKSMLPKLLDCIPDNSGFVNDLPAVRLIKLLSKYFSDSWQHILSSKEPLSPRPSIQITTDKFIIFLDYEIITETPSIDQALCVVISLYVLFELQFGSHNRIIQLLYGILLQEPGALTKPLRLLLNQWNFIVDKKEYKRNIQMPTTISTTTKTLTTTVENLIQAEDSQADNLYDSEEEQEYIENTTGLPSFFEEQNKSSIFALLGYIQSLTTTTPTSDEDLMKDYPLESSDSSNSSSPIDRPLLIHTLPTEKQQVITSPLPLLNDNPIRNVNIKHQTSSKSIDQSSTIQKKIIYAARKRSSSPDEPIASRLKRSRLKTKN
ncbi:unnamed protein product, partial [Rotaria sordida]